MVDCVFRSDVVSTGKFVDVPMQVFDAHFVIGSVVPTLQHRPRRFNAIGMYRPINVFLCRVLNLPVMHSGQAPVSLGLICEDMSTKLYALVNEIPQDFAVYRIRNLSVHVARPI